MTRIEAFLAIAAAGGLGAVVRDAADRALTRLLPGARLPAGTLAVNVLGSFALGVLLAGPAPGEVVLVAGVGFLGAFTTFSTFAVQAVRLPRVDAARYVVVMVAGCVAAAALGLVAG